MCNSRSKLTYALLILMVTIIALLPMVTGAAKPPAEKPAEKPKPDFPPLKEVIKDYEKVVSTAEGEKSYYTVWTREKDGQVLAALPSGFENKKFFIALTIASGESFAGFRSYS